MLAGERRRGREASEALEASQVPPKTIDQARGVTRGEAPEGVSSATEDGRLGERRQLARGAKVRGGTP